MFNVLLEIAHVALWLIVAAGFDVLSAVLYRKFTGKDLHELKSMAIGFIVAIPICPAWYIAMFWVIFALALYGMYIVRDGVIADKRIKWPHAFHNVMTLGVVIVFTGAHQLIV